MGLPVQDWRNSIVLVDRNISKITQLQERNLQWTNHIQYLE